MIGEDIVVTVLATNGRGFARLQIEAGFLEDSPRVARVKLRETYRITETISVLVDKIGRGETRLGITAPPEISIDREEVYLDKRKRPEQP